MPLDIIGLSNEGQTTSQLYPDGIVLVPRRGLIGDNGVIVVPQATIEEKHTDDLEITDHPVQLGAAITDHAFKRPSEITIQMGFSNSPSYLSPSDKYDNPLDVNQVYQALLDLQSQRVLMAVNTGKRNYQNMLIKGLVVTTDNKTENALFITVQCKQVIIVNTTTVQLTKTTQAKPTATTSPTNRGGVQTYNRKNLTPFAVNTDINAFKK